MVRCSFICFLLAFVMLFLGCAQEEPLEDQEEPIEEINSGSIIGTVTLANAEEYSGVKVSLTGTEFTAVTKKDGSFEISDVPAGLYSIHAELDGFVTAEDAVEVVAAEITEVKVTLQREIPEPPKLPNP